MKIKVNKLHPHEPGTIIDLGEADANGVPKGLHNAFWRRRLRDAKHDNCIEVVNEAPERAAKRVTEDIAESGGDE